MNMAIVQEKFRLDPNGWELVRTYSSNGMMVRQDETGELYGEAVDPVFTGRTYTETNIPIETEDDREARNIADGIEAGFTLWVNVADENREAVLKVLRQDVVDGKITEAQYEEFVGEPYIA